MFFILLSQESYSYFTCIKERDIDLPNKTHISSSYHMYNIIKVEYKDKQVY